MIIRYANGTVAEAALICRHENTMRVAVKGSDDAAEFTERDGTWIAENCEPVVIEFAWQHWPGARRVTEDECICPEELASRLIRLLFSGEPATDPEMCYPIHPIVGRLPGSRYIS